MLSSVLAMKFGGDGVVVVTLGEVVVTRGFAVVIVVVVTLAFVEFVELSAIALRKFTIKTININFSFIAFNFIFSCAFNKKLFAPFSSFYYASRSAGLLRSHSMHNNNNTRSQAIGVGELLFASLINWTRRMSAKRAVEAKKKFVMTQCSVRNDMREINLQLQLLMFN